MSQYALLKVILAKNVLKKLLLKRFALLILGIAFKVQLISTQKVKLSRGLSV